MKRSSKSHLTSKASLHYLVKPWRTEIDLIGMLINIRCRSYSFYYFIFSYFCCKYVNKRSIFSIQIVRRELINRITGISRHLMWFSYIRRDTTISVLTDSAGRYLFHKLCLPWYSVHHSLPPVRKCSNLRDRGHPYELPDLWPPNNSDLNPVDYKIWGNQSTRRKLRTWMMRCSVWLMCELEWNRALLTMALTTGADVSMPAFKAQDDIFEYSPWHKLVKPLLIVIN